MRTLRSTRVVLIDDESDEALPLLQVLSARGIGACYFTGQTDQLPAHPLDGIRVVFLDLRLFETLPGEPRHYIATTLAVLARVIAPTRGGTGIVYWTKHEEDIAELEKQLPARLPKFTPAFLLRVEGKMDLIADSTRLAEAIDAQIASHPAYGILWEWEQLVHRAAAKTSEMILEQSDPNEEGVLAILATLVRASAGEPGGDASSCMRHLYEGLNLVHGDQLEQTSRISRQGDGPPQALHEAVKRKVSLSSAQKAKLNRALLAGEVPDDNLGPMPGSVYIAVPSEKEQCPVTRFGLTAHMIEEWAPAGCGWPSWSKDQKYRALDREGKTDASKLLQRDGRKRQILDGCKAALVEVTPTCDYVQAKQGTARFVAAVLVPEGHSAVFEVRAQERTYLKHIPRVRLDLPEGDWHLILNARYLYAVPDPLREISARPLLRLRNHVLVDIQAWFAAHAARPGYISV